MDINLNIRLEAPELMTAILALAEAMRKGNLNGSLPAKMGQVVEAVYPVHAIEEIKEDTKKVSLEEVRAKLASLSEAGKQAEVKNLIKKYGANKLTEIGEKDYEALLKEAEAIYSLCEPIPIRVKL